MPPCTCGGLGAAAREGWAAGLPHLGLTLGFGGYRESPSFVSSSAQMPVETPILSDSAVMLDSQSVACAVSEPRFIGMPTAPASCLKVHRLRRSRHLQAGSHSCEYSPASGP